MTDSEGLEPLELLAAAAAARPVGRPPALGDVADRVTRRRRRRVTAMVGVLAVAGLGAGALWSERDTEAPTVATAPADVAPADDGARDAVAPGRLRLERFAAVGGVSGTEQVDIVIFGRPPDGRAVSVASLLEADPAGISYYVATSDDPLWICDSSHGWGGATAAVGVTMPADWFEPETLEIDGPIVDATSSDGTPAPVAKIIPCVLESGLWQVTIHGPRTDSADDVRVEVLDGVIRVVIAAPSTP